MVAAQCGSLFGATGPAQPLGMGALLEASKQVSGSDAEFVWVEEDFLVEQEAGAWMELPLWLPESEEKGN